MLRVGIVCDFSKITQLENHSTQVPVQVYMTSDSVLLTATAMPSPIFVAFIIPFIISMCPCPNCQMPTLYTLWNHFLCS